MQPLLELATNKHWNNQSLSWAEFERFQERQKAVCKSS